MDAVIREARENDLVEAWEIFYQDEILGLSPAPRRCEPIPLLHHQQTGLVLVAEQDGRVVGFTAGTVRSDVLYVSFLFIDPAYQGEAIGRALLRRLIESAEGKRMQVVSADNSRAFSLYLTEGFIPRTQLLWCEGEGGRLSALPDTDVELVEVDVDNAELLAWDTQTSGVERPQDMAYWAKHEGGRFFLAQRTGETIGYGCVRVDSPVADFHEKDFKGKASIGPAGADLVNIVDVTRALIRWSASQRPKVAVAIFASHAGLPELVRYGLRIDDLTPYMSSHEIFDPRCYLAPDHEL